MESLAEQVIATYLTQGRKVFICPSYPIDSGWSCPDFVALDFGECEVVVVEVTTASSPGPIIKKVRDREKQWFGKLRDQLKVDGIADGWRIRFLGFVKVALPATGGPLLIATSIILRAIKTRAEIGEWNKRQGPN